MPRRRTPAENALRDAIRDMHRHGLGRREITRLAGTNPAGAATLIRGVARQSFDLAAPADRGEAKAWRV